MSRLRWLLWLPRFFATYGSITVGSHILFEYDLPWILEKYLSIFRSTVRLFWIPYYLLIAVALAYLYRHSMRKLPAQ